MKFPICYEAVRAIVRKAGNAVGVKLRPHDLRRHAATHASRSGVPVEIVSRVILWNTNLSTTQRYLGKVTELKRSAGLTTYTRESRKGEAFRASPGFLCYRKDMQVLKIRVALGTRAGTHDEDQPRILDYFGRGPSITWPYPRLINTCGRF